MWTKVQQTVVQQNQTAINDEVAVQRVVRITWQSLLTNIDTLSRSSDSLGSRVSDLAGGAYRACGMVPFSVEHLLLSLPDQWAKY